MTAERAEEIIGQISFGSSSTTVEWKIRNYFDYPRDVDHSFSSPVFSFLDGTWCLLLYPNGRAVNQTEGWISLYLHRKSSNSEVNLIQYELGIMRPDGSFFRNINGEQRFKRSFKSYGFTEYIRAKVLNKKKKEIVPEGVLTIACTMRANTCEGVQAAVQTETLLGAEKISEDFKNLLQSEESTDVTLEVRNREYKVHRAVLAARSTVFSAMFKHDMKEKLSGVVEIEDCDPDVFQQFLLYIYSGNVEKFSVDTVCDLYSIADKYDVQELKTGCAQFIMNNFSTETICDVVTLALKHKESELQDKAITFFAKHFMEILVTTKWLSFLKKHPVESNELIIKATKYNSEHQKINLFHKNKNSHIMKDKYKMLLS